MGYLTAEKWNVVEIPDDFDLQKIGDSGQCFRVRCFPDGCYRFVTGQYVLYIREESPHRFEVSCTAAEWEAVWMVYFDLSRDYAAVRRSVPEEDSFLRLCAAEGEGIRILRQEPWETLVTFIISQRKSIPAIKGSVELLCERFGRAVETEREQLFLFPTPQELARASAEELAECRLGYRVPYVLDAIDAAVSGRLSPEGLAALEDEELFHALQSIRGVGAKVSNCVCLFAYGRTALAPVDTWIARIIGRHYGGRDPFPAYGDAAGIMQQYAFYHAQLHKRERDGL